MASKLRGSLACVAVLACSLLSHVQAAPSTSVWPVAQIGALGGEKPVAEVVQLGEGMRAFFATANERGGVNGSRIDFFQLDDGNNPDRFASQFAEAMKRKPVALLSPFGSGQVQRLLQGKLLETADTVVINTVPGAEAFRKPGHPRLFHVRAGDGRQIQKIVTHVKTLGLVRLGVLYAGSAAGQSGFDVAAAAAREAGNMEVTGFKTDISGKELSAAAAALKQGNMQSALVIGPPHFGAMAVAELRKAGFSQPMFGLSYLLANDVVKTAGDNARGVGISQTFPNPMGGVTALQREFRSAMRKSFPSMTTYSAFHLEGYVCAKLFLEVAKRMKEPSAAEFAKTLKAMGELDLGNFRVDFSQSAAGSQFVDIGVINYKGNLIY